MASCEESLLSSNWLFLKDKRARRRDPQFIDSLCLLAGAAFMGWRLSSPGVRRSAEAEDASKEISKTPGVLADVCNPGISAEGS